MVGESRVRDFQLALNVAHHEPFRMRREQQLHDAQARLGAHGRKHVGVLGNALTGFAGRGHRHISILLAIWIYVKIKTQRPPSLAAFCQLRTFPNQRPPSPSPSLSTGSINPNNPFTLLFGPAAKKSWFLLPLMEGPPPPPKSIPQSWSITIGFPAEFLTVPRNCPLFRLKPLIVLAKLILLPISSAPLSDPKFF